MRRSRRNMKPEVTCSLGLYDVVGLHSQTSGTNVTVQANSFIYRCDGMAISVASALVLWSRLDQVNSILYGAASKHINRLQRVQNALARIVTQRPYTSPLSSTALLQNLHWLPIEWRVHFKLATLTYKALHTGQPPYLSELLQHYEPTRTLWSSSFFQLSVPRYNLEFGSGTFRISA